MIAFIRRMCDLLHASRSAEALKSMRVDRKDVAMSPQALRKLYEPQYENCPDIGRPSLRHAFLAVAEIIFCSVIQMNDAPGSRKSYEPFVAH